MILHASARALPLLDDSVQCVVTSPPYWGGVRDYGYPEQIGLERNPADYVTSLVDVFKECRRVLRSDGTVWLNIGDVYAASGKGGGGSAGDRNAWSSIKERKGFRMPPPGYKMKDLTLAPFLVADALRQDGWYLRSTIIWRKPAAVEPMRFDRPAVSHEYVFLLSKSLRYYATSKEKWWGHTVWDIPTNRAFAKFHAAMPLELARRCVVAGSRVGDIVLDPFGGSGTTAAVASLNYRLPVSCDLNPGYLQIQRERACA